MDKIWSLLLPFARRCVFCYNYTMNMKSLGIVPEGEFLFRDKPGSRSISMRDVGFPEVVRISHVCQRQMVEQSADHIHSDAIEIELCVKGRVLYSNAGSSYRLSAGSLYVSGAGVPHHLVDFPKNFEHYGICVAIPEKGASFLGFTPRETEALFKRLKSLPPVPDANTRRIHRTFRELFAAYDSLKGQERTLAMRALMMVLLAEVAGLAPAENERASDPSRRERIVAIADEMVHSPEKPYPLDALAGRVFLSVQNFSAQFRRVTGWSPHAYLVRCRISAAKRLLRKGVSVAAAGERLGFSSISHFSSEFKRIVGSSPSEYIKRHRGS